MPRIRSELTITWLPSLEKIEFFHSAFVTFEEYIRTVMDAVSSLVAVQSSHLLCRANCFIRERCVYVKNVCHEQYLSLSLCDSRRKLKSRLQRFWKSGKRENFCVTKRAKLPFPPPPRDFPLKKVAHEITTHGRQIHTTYILSGFSKRFVAKSKRSC